MESGAASSLLAIAEYGRVPLAPSQRDLTPLQRMVILKEAERQQEEAEERAGKGSNTPMKNNYSNSGGRTISGDTVQYVNEGE